VAIGEDVGLDAEVQQAVARLTCVQPADGAVLVHLGARHVRGADGADLALPLEVEQALHRVGDRRGLGRHGRPVGLVEVKAVHAQPAEALLDFDPDRVRPK